MVIVLGKGGSIAGPYIYGRPGPAVLTRCLDARTGKSRALGGHAEEVRGWFSHVMRRQGYSVTSAADVNAQPPPRSAARASGQGQEIRSYRQGDSIHICTHPVL